MRSEQSEKDEIRIMTKIETKVKKIIVVLEDGKAYEIATSPKVGGLLPTYSVRIRQVTNSVDTQSMMSMSFVGQFTRNPTVRFSPMFPDRVYASVVVGDIVDSFEKIIADAEEAWRG